MRRGPSGQLALALGLHDAWVPGEDFTALVLAELVRRGPARQRLPAEFLGPGRDERHGRFVAALIVTWVAAVDEHGVVSACHAISMKRRTVRAYLADMPNVWTGGTWDLLHPGHVALLRQCAHIAAGGRVIAAVNSDRFVLRYKQRGPVQNLTERLQMVSAVRYVDDVQINEGGDTQPGLILDAATDVIVVGDDWKHRNYHAQLGITGDWLTEHDIYVTYVTRADGHSSTALKERIRLP